MKDIQWEVLNKLPASDVIEVLLKNRAIKNKQEFFSPTHPKHITLKEVGISSKEVKKAIGRISEAKQKGEKIIIFGDYDADGICATAILWEALHSFGANVVPFIPNRFTNGYGIKQESIEKLFSEHPDLRVIITVDNGIVAHDAVEFANTKGIDVIISDHHAPLETNPKALAVIHTTKTSGSGVAWFLSRELVPSSLELAAIGTVADQLPLLGVNRSVVKYGIEDVHKTTRVGLVSLFTEARIAQDQVSTYEIGFLIAPRINAMGRLGEGIESLRLICTKSPSRALELARLMGKTNIERQKIVEQVVLHARGVALEVECKGAVCLVHESYHEGIIGLAASKLVEEFRRPAIVISKGEVYSKASARSISGINITQILREMKDLLKEVGGHEMAAGFTIETAKLPQFQAKLEELTAPLMTDKLQSKVIKIDTPLHFGSINWDLVEKLVQFEPTGIGNPIPLFMTTDVEVIDKKAVGSDGKHLKLRVREESKILDAIAFGLGEYLNKVDQNPVDIAYSIEANVWNGSKSIQLKIKDIKL